MSLLALYEAHFTLILLPHATQTYGLCAAGLAQVKAVGLTVVFDHNYFPHRFFR